jgi:hypothetical protein
VEKSATSVLDRKWASTSLQNNDAFIKSAGSPTKKPPVKVGETFPKSLSISAVLGLGKVVKTPSD